MKKPQIPILVVVTIAFAAFTLGFFFGRNQNQNPVQLSVSPQMTAPRISTIPTETEAPPDSKEPAVHFPIDLNSATMEELMALPGIGETYANRIVEYRKEHGLFLSVNDLENVPGIGKKRLESLAEFITVGG